MAIPEGIEFKKNDEFSDVVILGIYKYKMHVGFAIGYKKRDGMVHVYLKKLTLPGVFPKEQRFPIRVPYNDIEWVRVAQ